jgi:hypothetical protein
VAGYLLRDDDPADPPEHIRAVTAGGTAWDPLAGALIGDRGDRAVLPSSPEIPSPCVDEFPEQFRQLK